MRTVDELVRVAPVHVVLDDAVIGHVRPALQPGEEIVLHELLVRRHEPETRRVRALLLLPFFSAFLLLLPFCHVSQRRDDWVARRDRSQVEDDRCSSFDDVRGGGARSSGRCRDRNWKRED